MTVGSPVLPGAVAGAARRFGDRRALVAPDGWALTYGALHGLTDEVAAGLAERGVGEGDVVALLLPSSVDYLATYLAAAKLGVVIGGVNPRAAPAERTRALATIGPDLVLGTPDLLEGVNVGGADVVSVPLSGRADDLLAEVRVAGGAPPALAADPDRPVAVVLTSGTTGPPRGALFTDRQLAAIGRIDAGEQWGGGGPMLISTEPVHVGVMTKLAWYVRRGMRMHLLRRWRAADALRVIADERMRSIGGVSAQIAMMLRVEGLERYDLSAVETIVVGGGPSSPGLVRAARERFGAAYSIRYSSTESGGVGTATAFDAPDEEALHTVGRPRPGVEVAIRGGDGGDLPAGEVGRVALRSPAVMARYWRDDEATAATLVDGWLQTGDLGYRDPAGRLVLTGRASEMFIRGGYNVHPQQVEAVLGTHPQVAEVAVVPRPDPVMGEVGVAVVVPREVTAPPTLDDLRRFGGDRLARYELPEALRILDTLPRTPMDKLDRRALAAHESDT